MFCNTTISQYPAQAFINILKSSRYAGQDSANIDAVLQRKGLSSVSTLILGTKAAALVDPPFLRPDANAVVDWIKKSTFLPLKAVFITHHHPNHYFSANPILDAFPGSQLFAAPYGKWRNMHGPLPFGAVTELEKSAPALKGVGCTSSAIER